jgi:hypothetical protein
LRSSTNGAPSAHRFDQALAAGMDDEEQSDGNAGGVSRCMEAVA